MVKKILLLFLISVISCAATAQKRGVISGILVDSAKQTSFINFATISLYKSVDTSLVTYTLSDMRGNFQFTNVETGIQYKVVITAWQHKTIRKELSIGIDSIKFNLGKIPMISKDHQLEEVEIIGEIPPIVIRNDTIEFNAASFKTLPTAFLEDLFRKLPGFRIASNGDVQVNGRQVSRILVDGREFFGGDKQIATKQLPANIVDKIIVMDDDIEKRRNPDLSKINSSLVINLTLKKGVKKGAFGKIYGGKALDDKFETGGILNLFRDTLQISILGYGNNINRSGFTISDMTRIGGFGRSGYRNTVMNENGSFSLDNISFGGGENGRQKSSGAGINFNTIFDGNIKFNTKYFYGRNKTDLNQSVLDRQTIGVNRLIVNSGTTLETINNSHNLGGKIEWPINKLTKFYLEGSVISNPTENATQTEKVSEDGEQNLINTTRNFNRTLGVSNQYSISADLDKSFKNPRRTLFLSLYGQKSKLANTNTNSSYSRFYVGDINSTIDQLRDNELSNSSLYFSSNYSEPLSKNLSLGMALNTNYSNHENALLTYYKNPDNQQYDLFVPSSSETVLQSGLKMNARIRLRWAVSKVLNIQPSFIVNTINLENSFTNYSLVRQRYSFISPAATLKYKILTIEYLPTMVEPDIRYIQPVLNNTDPLFIQTGNPNLKATKTYPLFLRIYNYNQKTNFNYNLFANASVRTGSLMMSRKITESGVQISTPVSIDGVWEISSGGGFGKNFKTKNAQTSIFGGFNLNVNRNFVEVNSVLSEATNVSITPNLGLSLNLKDKIDVVQYYSISFNNTSYSDSYFLSQQYQTHRSRTDLTIRYVKKVIFDTQFNFLFNNQNLSNHESTIAVWNLGISYLFSKNDRAQLRLSANDLLQSNVRRNIIITENNIRDMQTSSLGKFVMLTLSYNIQNFGPAEKKSTILKQQ